MVVDELSTSAYVVLGLIARYGPMTSYDLKASLARSIGWFWPIPHALLYRYPAKLVQAGLLDEHLEEFGRRRRVFHLTPAGRLALESWLSEVSTPELETRDPAAVKLALADLTEPDPAPALARAQAKLHQGWLETYQQRLESLDHDAADGLSRARLLRFGIAISQAYADYWQSVRVEGGLPGTRQTDQQDVP